MEFIDWPSKSARKQSGSNRAENINLAIYLYRVQLLSVTKYFEDIQHLSHQLVSIVHPLK